MGHLPKNTPPIDYGNIPIKKLPPGEAFGARDLTTWAVRRADGKSGTGGAETVVAKMRCKCGWEGSVLAARRQNHSRVKGDLTCRDCGGRAKVVTVGLLKVRKRKNG